MRWKLSTFDHVRKMKRELTARLGGIQRSIQSGNRHSGLVMLEGNLQRELGVILKKEDYYIVEVAGEYRELGVILKKEENCAYQAKYEGEN